MKIPKQAKKVFTGEIFDVYQWPQKMYDGSIATFEMLKRPDTVQVIPTIGNKILVNKQKQPQNKNYYYSFFGGRVDKGELPLAAAKRELLEESGCTSTDWQLFKSYQPHAKLDWTIYVYIARNCKKTTAQNLDNGEKIKIIELNFQNFINFLTGEKFWIKDFILDILKTKLDGKLNQFKKRLFKK